MDIESLRDFCLSLPGATEAIRWEHHLNFYIGGKMFCISTLDAEGRVSFKVPEEEYEEIAARPGMIKAPYLARMKWVFVEHYDSLSEEEWRAFLTDSYRLVREKLPKKVQSGLPAF
ncbi:MAG: MmcQ/YjbR family DNA-binding protein [Lewinellaceae bacterium]|nr:MmcQ/YjbR family DNA-binding protein [Lewinellaceae bacterium]